MIHQFIDEFNAACDSKDEEGDKKLYEQLDVKESQANKIKERLQLLDKVREKLLNDDAANSFNR